MGGERRATTPSQWQEVGQHAVLVRTQRLTREAPQPLACTQFSRLSIQGGDVATNTAVKVSTTAAAANSSVALRRRRDVPLA